MLATLPIANAQNADQSRSQALAKLRFAALEILQPGVLCVFLLILFVSGCSYGRKLSHYLHNSDLTKASTTRMWIDHRQDSASAPVQNHQVEHKFLTPQLCIFAVPPLPHLSREQVLASPAPSLTASFVSPLHLLRAPPISSLA